MVEWVDAGHPPEPGAIMKTISREQLHAYLDDALSESDLAMIEQALRESESLRQRLRQAMQERDRGDHSLGAVWRRDRLTCPNARTTRQLSASGARRRRPQLHRVSSDDDRLPLLRGEPARFAIAPAGTGPEFPRASPSLLRVQRRLSARRARREITPFKLLKVEPHLDVRQAHVAHRAGGVEVGVELRAEADLQLGNRRARIDGPSHIGIQHPRLK